MILSNNVVSFYEEQIAAKYSFFSDMFLLYYTKKLQFTLVWARRRLIHYKVVPKQHKYWSVNSEPFLQCNAMSVS